MTEETTTERTAGTDELDAIRRRKREALEARVNGETVGERGEDNGDGGSPNEPIHVNGSEEFDSLVAGGVVLVDFHADWCGPCKMLEPTVATLAAETDATVAKVDVDANQSLAARYDVRGVPTLLLFSGGEPVERIVGVRDAATLRSLIEQYA